MGHGPNGGLKLKKTPTCCENTIIIACHYNITVFSHSFLKTIKTCKFGGLRPMRHGLNGGPKLEKINYDERTL
jgi:hypothetical protein